MRPVTALCLVLLAGCAAEPPKPEPAPRPEPTRPSELRVGPPVREGNLAVYPVLGGKRAAVPLDALTLEEAIAKGLVTVRETGVVERLEIDNAADVPVLIVGGEVVRGGRQDRVVAEDVLVAAGARGVGLDVLCVEHGRWSLRPGVRGFAVAEAFADPSLRALERDQQKVWDEVARKQRTFERARLAEQNRTSSYAHLAGNGRLAARTEALAAALERALAAAADGEPAVGFVAAIDGRLVAADVFAAPDLAAKLRPRLLRSYALEALARPAMPAPLAAAPAPESAEAFIRGRLEARPAAIHTAILEK